MLALKKAGRKVKILGKTKETPIPLAKPTVEQSLMILATYVKKIALKPDKPKDTANINELIVETLIETLAKIKDLSQPKKVKAWDIKVLRDDEQLIKSLQLKAVE